jgi:hypothetical protein
LKTFSQHRYLYAIKKQLHFLHFLHLIFLSSGVTFPTSGAFGHSGGGSVRWNGASKISYGASVGLNSLENLSVRSLENSLWSLRRSEFSREFDGREPLARALCALADAAALSDGYSPGAESAESAAISGLRRGVGSKIFFLRVLFGFFRNNAYFCRQETERYATDRD